MHRRIASLVVFACLGAACAPTVSEDPENSDPAAQPDPGAPDAGTDPGQPDAGGPVAVEWVKIVSPVEGTRLDGTAELKVAYGPGVKGGEWLVDGQATPMKRLATSIWLDTTALGNGVHSLGVRVHDAAGVEHNAFVLVEYANASFQLVEASFDEGSYRNGQELVVELDYGRDGLAVSADLGDLDDHFSAAAVVVEPLGGGRYRLRYPISSGNGRPDGDHTLLLTAAAGAEELRSEMAVKLANIVAPPFQVEDAIYWPETPREERRRTRAGLPAIDSLAGPTGIVTGGAVTLTAHWTTPAGQEVKRLWVQFTGFAGGFQVVPKSHDAHTFLVTLPMKAADVPDAVDVQVTPVNAAGSWGTPMSLHLLCRRLKDADLRFSAAWSGAADIDLHVVDPTGAEISWQNPTSKSGGNLDLDSNAQCTDTTGLESVSYPDPVKPPPQGAYKVYLNLFDACSAAGADVTLTLNHCGKTETKVQHFDAAEVSQTGSGKLIATVNVACDTRVSGRVRYFRRIPVLPKGKWPGFTDSKNTLVQAIRVSDNKVLAQTGTGADGRYTLIFDNSGHDDFAVEAQARTVGVVVDATGSRPIVGVQDKAGKWQAKRADEVVKGATTGKTGVNIDLVKSSRYAGAFHIVQVLQRAHDWVRVVMGPIRNIGAQDWGTTVTWQQGFSPAGGVTHAGDPMEVQGTEADPDEFDDPVLCHEFFHNVMSNLSGDDSPGGNHSGQSVPTLAWSEGVATFFGVTVAEPIPGHPALYWDTFQGGATGNNLETADGTGGVSLASISGTADGTMTGNVDEELVASMLWDISDARDAANEPLDLVDSRLGGIIDVVVNYLRTEDNTRFKDRGVAGRDLVDFLDGWQCRTQGDKVGMATLTLVYTFPYDWAALASCP
jgi:hypothetical protein